MAKWKKWYKDMGWSETLFTFEYENLVQLHEFIENKIKLELRELEAKFDEYQENAISEEDRDYLIASNEDEYHNLNEGFPTASRYALVILSYSLLENTMLKYCKVIERKTNPLSPVEFYFKQLGRKSVIQKAWYYMKYVGAVKLRDKSRRWKKLETQYRVIRNSIVHENGIVPKKNRVKVKKLFRCLKHGKLVRDKKISLEKQFVLNFMKTIDDFIVLEMFDRSSRRHRLSEN